MPTTDIEPEIESLFFLNQYNNINTPIIQQHQWHKKISFYKLIWVKEGVGSHLINGFEQPLISGQIYILAPGHIHNWKKNTLFKGVLCELSHGLLDDCFQKKLITLQQSNTNNGPIHVPKDKENLLSHLVNSIEIETKNNNRLSIIRPLFTTFLHLLEPKENTLHSLSSNTDPLKNLDNLIENFYFKENGVHFYAQQLDMGIKQLNALVREVHGKTVSNLIHERIISDAKLSLQSSHSSVKSIAYDLGFEDPSYFSRFFRRYTGLSPNQYREAKISS